MIRKKSRTGDIRSHAGVFFILLIMVSSGCGQKERVITHSGKLVALEFEHRNVVEYKGDGGPEVSLLVTRGRVQGSIPEGGITLHYRVNEGPFQELEMHKTASGRRYLGRIPHQPGGSLVDYYIRIEHRRGKILTFPENAESGEYFTIHIK